jgi:uncharacterized membrane protein YjfL (UPF0719 family)
MENNKRHSFFYNTGTVIIEILGAIIGIYLGDITTKIGLSFHMIIIGLVFLLAPVSGSTDKPVALFIFGAICLLIGLILFIVKSLKCGNQKNKIDNVSLNLYIIL